MTSAFYNRVRFAATSSGTGAFTAGAAMPGYRAPSVMPDGATVSYTAEASDGTWETGHGTWHAAGNLSRDTPLEGSSATPVNFSLLPIVWVDALAQDFSYVQWVRYTGPPQSFLSQQMTRDGDWTMVANKNTSDRPAPQESGSAVDLLPAWTPATQNARASYTVYNEWTLSQAGWIDQYGIDIINQNTGALHAISLSLNGVVKDTFSSTPNVAGPFWQNITPIVATVGTVIRVTLQVTQIGSQLMYWLQQGALFATAPIYCSLAQGSKDGGAAGTMGYGCHLQFIPGTSSPDWDIVAFAGAGASGGGLSEAPQDGFSYGRLNAAWSKVQPLPVQRNVTATPITVAATDDIITVNISTGAAACTLPTAASRAGKAIVFKDVGGHFAANNLTITPAASETIDGLASIVLSTNWQNLRLVPLNDGVSSGWMIVG
jgi:hypothetical protein